MIYLFLACKYKFLSTPAGEEISDPCFYALTGTMHMEVLATHSTCGTFQDDLDSDLDRK